MSEPIELVIFDNDGVLVDSEHLTHSVLVEMLAEVGLRMHLSEALGLFKGGKMTDCLTEIERRRGAPLAEDFEPTFRARCERKYLAELRPISGVAALLRSLRVPFCVASNGPEAKIRTTLRAAGLLGHFEGRVFSAYTRAVFKPEPDLFLWAAEVCGVAPSNSVVVEDSVHGVRAARAAGMRVFGYAPAGDVDGLAQLGAEVVSSMEELARRLQPPA